MLFHRLKYKELDSRLRSGLLLSRPHLFPYQFEPHRICASVLLFLENIYLSMVITSNGQGMISFEKIWFLSLQLALQATIQLTNKFLVHEMWIPLLLPLLNRLLLNARSGVLRSSKKKPEISTIFCHDDNDNPNFLNTDRIHVHKIDDTFWVLVQTRIALCYINFLYSLSRLLPQTNILNHSL